MFGTGPEARAPDTEEVATAVLENLKVIVSQLFRRMLAGNAIKQPGSVSKNVFAYLTTGQWLTLGAVVMIVTLSWEQLSTAFLTNVPLNGQIVSVMLIGVGRAVFSNVKLWRTGAYLHRIDALVESSIEPTEQHVQILRCQPSILVRCFS